MTKAIPSILKVQFSDHDSKEYNRNSDMLSEFVNFGTHVLDYKIRKVNSDDHNIPLIIILRHIIELADSISILVTKNSIEPCKVILRALVESVFGLEYLVESDTKNRAIAFLVWQAHKDIDQNKKFISGNDHNLNFTNKLASDSFVPFALNDEFEPSSKEHNEILKSLLKSINYEHVESIYQQKKSNNKKRPRQWFDIMNDIENLENLAKHLKRQGFYEMIYRKYSGATHGVNIINGRFLGVKDGKISISPLRKSKNLKDIMGTTLNLLVYSFMIVCEEEDNIYSMKFSQWYHSIQDKYLNFFK